MGSLRNLGKKCRDEVSNFIPTPVKEFEKLDLLFGEKVLIQYIDICPTTHLKYVTEIKNADVYKYKIEDSKFNFSFCTTNEHGQDHMIKPEATKFIKRIPL